MSIEKFISISVGKKLRQLRKQKGVNSADQLAELMGRAYSASGILRREEGKLKINSDYLECFCNSLRVDDKEKANLFTTAKLDLWRSQQSAVGIAREFYNIQANAEKVCTFLTHTIHGALQTYEYAKTIIGRYNSNDTVEEEVKLRLIENEKVLRDDKKEIKICLAETCLYFPVGSPKLMIDQLNKIKAFQDTYIASVRILPSKNFSTAPDQMSFDIFDSHYTFCETRIGLLTAEDDETVKELTQDFNNLWEHSISGEARDALIDKAIAHYQAMLDSNKG